MAKFTPFLGNISGKISANVFARNKGGNYIRAHRAPTNPNSPAQQRARASFGASSRLWSGLSASLKSAWNSFAASGFSPKKPTPGVVYSGAAALASHANQISAINYNADGSAVVKEGATDIDMTYVPFSLPVAPPQELFSAVISDATAQAESSITLESAGYTVTDTPKVTLNFTTEGGNVDTTDWAAIDFNSLFGNSKFGFIVYATKSVNPSGGAQKQINPITLSSTQLFNKQVTRLAPSTPFAFSVEMSPSIHIIDSKYTIVKGDNIELSVYAVSQSGASVLLGSKFIAVS